MRADLLANRTFALSDQMRFADATGDRNPLHVDEVFARRTQAGSPAVHGMHLLLWAIDSLASTHSTLPIAGGIKARFSNFVLIGEQAELKLLELGQRRARMAITVNAVTSSLITVDFSETGRPEPRSGHESVMPQLDVPDHPRDVDFETMLSSAGSLSITGNLHRIAEQFPAASAWIGSRRVAALGASSTVVGMICPGLHSIYGSLAATLVDEATVPENLGFQVASSDARFRLLRLSLAGSGISAIVECMARIPPVTQETMQSLAGIVGPNEFRGSTALIVGGSRGLGELVAKIVATGGGKVFITHRAGRADAERVRNEINAAGGNCTCIEYDVRQPAERQLTASGIAPTHVYYFATPLIFRQQAEEYSRERLSEFLEFYVDGFWDLIQFLHGRNQELSAFYPSTVFAGEAPRGMLEYAMAKCAGETLCHRLNELLAPLHVLVSRLPRLATDQTASNLPVETQPALQTLLPLVRQVQSQQHTGS